MAGPASILSTPPWQCRGPESVFSTPLLPHIGLLSLTVHFQTNCASWSEVQAAFILFGWSLCQACFRAGRARKPKIHETGEQAGSTVRTSVPHYLFIYVFMYLFVCVSMCMVGGGVCGPQHMREVKGQFHSSPSLLPPLCGFSGSDSGAELGGKCLYHWVISHVLWHSLDAD